MVEQAKARIKCNMLFHDCTPAPMFGLRKDHKHNINPLNGPTVRPVYGAVTAYNRKLSVKYGKMLKVYVSILKKCWRSSNV